MNLVHRIRQPVHTLLRCSSVTPTWTFLRPCKYISVLPMKIQLSSSTYEKGTSIHWTNKIFLKKLSTMCQFHKTASSSVACQKQYIISFKRNVRWIQYSLSPRLNCVYVRKLSDHPSNDAEKHLKDDPEVKKYLGDINGDFKSDSGSDSSDSDNDEVNETVEKNNSNVKTSEEYEEHFSFGDDKPKDTTGNMETGFDDFTASDESQYEDFIDVEYDEDTEEFETDEIEQIPISLTRGSSGVYDLDEFMVLLESENVVNPCAISVRSHMNYVDYMVIGTCRSTRHIKAVAQQIKRLYKKKRERSDPPSVKIEGENNSDNWMAMDLGNIAVHLFLEETRSYYDLESLWTLGPELDPQCQTFVDDPQSLSSLLHMQGLEQPAWMSVDWSSIAKEEQVEQVLPPTGNECSDTQQVLPSVGLRTHNKEQRNDRNGFKKGIKSANLQSMESMCGWHEENINETEKPEKKENGS